MIVNIGVWSKLCTLRIQGSNFIFTLYVIPSCLPLIGLFCNYHSGSDFLWPCLGIGEIKFYNANCSCKILLEIRYVYFYKELLIDHTKITILIPTCDIVGRFYVSLWLIPVTQGQKIFNWISENMLPVVDTTLSTSTSAKSEITR